MNHKKKGAALICVVAFLGFLLVLSFSLTANIGMAWSKIKKGEFSKMAFWLAEAGMQKALLELEEYGDIYSGEEMLLGEGRCMISITKNEDDTFLIFSTGEVGTPPAKKTIEATISLGQNRNSSHTIEVKQWKEE
ncbi:MAG TPA: hypothetical protein PLL89_00235 [bacterium]|jgi:hypothetical protein|uniref:Type 4 fimbrial biogenesis protein PilX N-terminal domain-containing protein n=1 Tax=candidate division TA06 bacterium ADurb.Bin131 TaxID=1852827 RepID=A0A1V6CDK1_UNCT6|nr:MAG: hypothetical protein BWX89_00241 [candidate division TA06 bacterium ADurb.Bin131]HOC01847.1 hypothetical protein [bacterium]HRV03504.1 hypothetical protein [Candidatus Ratteibacteria bacterium]HON04967.1 hypothetical protein [bacterium]HOQ81470.1 hypothetical protein [bacterium]